MPKEIKVGEICPAKKYKTNNYTDIYYKAGSYACLTCKYNQVPGFIDGYIRCKYEENHE